VHRDQTIAVHGKDICASTTPVMGACGISAIAAAIDVGMAICAMGAAIEMVLAIGLLITMGFMIDDSPRLGALMAPACAMAASMTAATA
jgi:hypothetical protein